MWKTSGRIKTERLTAVLQDGEKCGGYTFLARKKNKINRKLTASEARHLAKPQNVSRHPNRPTRRHQQTYKKRTDQAQLPPEKT